MGECNLFEKAPSNLKYRLKKVVEITVFLRDVSLCEFPAPSVT